MTEQCGAPWSRVGAPTIALPLGVQEGSSGLIILSHNHQKYHHIRSMPR
jgi:hypothetical protein